MLLACLGLFAGGSCASAQADLIGNGSFDRRTDEGWAEGWTRLAPTADCTLEIADDGTGNWAVHIAGQSRLSKAGLVAPIGAIGEAPALRVTVRYRGTREGRRMIVVRPQGTPPDDTKVGEKALLPPAPDWRPGGGVVKLPATKGETPAAWEVVLRHEGPGETWFDDVQVLPELSQERPTYPGIAPGTALAGPYVVAHHPADGDVLQVNPPRFCWPGRPGGSYTVEWSQSPQFPPDATQRVEGLKLNLYIPEAPLAAGQWYWRVSETGAPPVPTAPADLPSLQPTEEPPAEEPPIEASPVPTDPTAPELTPAPEGGSEEEAPPPAEPPKGKRKPKRERPPRAAGQQPAEPPPPEPSPELQPTEAVPAPEPPPGPEPAPSIPVAPDFLAGGPPPTAPVTAASAARSFRVAADAVQLPVPSVAQIVQGLPAHPRIWLNLDGLVTLRGQVAGPLKAEWEALRARLDAARAQPLAEEPKTKGKWRNPSPKQLEANEEILKVAADEAALVRDNAFAALVSGEQPYADEAKRRALNLAAWDAKGSTGYASHDQAFREILLSLALTLDWIPQSLPAEERTRITEAVVARAGQLHTALSAGPRPLSVFPYSSHGQTAVGFLAIAALAAAGDIAEAQEWLEFALPTAVGLFSPWASDDGGWLQGETYWKRSAPFTFQLFDALKSAAGIDLYQLPWASHTAEYKVTMHPPYSTRGAFGDGPELPPDAADRLACRRLAAARGDALAAWYAAGVTVPEGEPTCFTLLWRDPGLQPQPPDGLPTGRAFLDSGLFAIHSSLTDPLGLHLYGRASRFGSYNHAHADQGHFSLYAFGEPLLIDGGYYDWYRSPHATSFARTSLAHNVLLLSGNVGQRTGDITARGKTETFIHTDVGDYAQVQAAEAYPEGLLSAYQRRFVYLRPGWVVVLDHVEPGQEGLEAGLPSGPTSGLPGGLPPMGGAPKLTCSWLLQSLEEPTLDAAGSTALVRRGAAALAVGAFGPERLTWSATKAFPRNPQFTEDDVAAPPQWHMTIKSAKPAAPEDLLLILAPFQGDAAPTMASLQVTDGRGAEAAFGGARLTVLVRRPAPPPKPPRKPPREVQPAAAEEPAPAEPPEGEAPAEPPSESTEAEGATGPPPEPAAAAAGEKPRRKPKKERQPPPEAAGELPAELPAPPPPVAMVVGDLRVDAERVVLLTTAEGADALFAQELLSLVRADKAVLTSSVPALVLGSLGPQAALTVEVSERSTIALALAGPPAKAMVDGAEQPVVYADGVLTLDLAPGRHQIQLG